MSSTSELAQAGAAPAPPRALRAVAIVPARNEEGAIGDLLADPAQAEEMGRRARERVLDEHTYAHRARQILELVGLGAPVGARG